MVINDTALLVLMGGRSTVTALSFRRLRRRTTPNKSSVPCSKICTNSRNPLKSARRRLEAGKLAIVAVYPVNLSAICNKRDGGSIWRFLSSLFKGSIAFVNSTGDPLFKNFHQLIFSDVDWWDNFRLLLTLNKRRSLIVKKGLLSRATNAISSPGSAKNFSSDQASLASWVSNRFPPPEGAKGIWAAARASP